MMEMTTIIILALGVVAWLWCLTVAVMVGGFAAYRYIQTVNDAQRWDRLLWFGMGFATNIFFPLVRPLYRDREQHESDDHSEVEASRPSVTPATANARSTVPQFTTTSVSGQELQDLLNLFSGAGATVPLASVPLRRPATTGESATRVRAE